MIQIRTLLAIGCLVFFGGCEVISKTPPTASARTADPAPKTEEPKRETSSLLRGGRLSSRPKTESTPKAPPATDTTTVTSTPGLPWVGPPELKAYAGRVVFIDFFGAWCGSCEISCRYMQVVHERFMDDPEVAVIAAHVGPDYDRWDSAAHYLEDIGVSYPAIEDGNSIAAQYGVESLPAFVMLNRKGENVHQQQGMFASNINSFIAMIENEKSR